MTRQVHTRRGFLKRLGVAAVAAAAAGPQAFARPQEAGRKPNFIVIFIDDMGYGDIGPFGSKKNRTPQLDRMAAEGMRFTSFYVTSSVCTPSRSSLMTGCYPRRVNLHQDERNLCVLFPSGRKGLNPNETTIAEVVKCHGALQNRPPMGAPK